MKSGVRLFPIFVALCASIASLRGQGKPSWHIASGLDAHGVRHYGDQYSGRPPWLTDITYKFTPDYPMDERAKHHVGSALFRLSLDLKTGSVTTVRMLKSTGFPVLDQLAVDAFRQWRWRPEKWKEVDLPITFTMLSHYR